ncbi:hypothetical protein SDC9_175395 [bioreactor metagenome]|uniref:Uncharacterized protein n=1 Tax=bioreactor metagenome TaxID=1076179 RepID=A0A645GLZ5_9ZZZZ
MSDRKRGAVFGELRESVLNELFCFRVERRGRFVENEYSRIVEYCAGYRYTLAFAAGHAVSLFTDHRIITLRQTDDEIMRVGNLCRLDNFLVCRERRSVFDVFTDCSGKKERLLKHHTYLTAERML